MDEIILWSFTSVFFMAIIAYQIFLQVASVTTELLASILAGLLLVSIHVLAFRRYRNRYYRLSSIKIFIATQSWAVNLIPIFLAGLFWLGESHQVADETTESYRGEFIVTVLFVYLLNLIGILCALKNRFLSLKKSTLRAHDSIINSNQKIIESVDIHQISFLGNVFKSIENLFIFFPFYLSILLFFWPIFWEPLLDSLGREYHPQGFLPLHGEKLLSSNGARLVTVNKGVRSDQPWFLFEYWDVQSLAQVRVRLDKRSFPRDVAIGHLDAVEISSHHSRSIAVLFRDKIVVWSGPDLTVVSVLNSGDGVPIDDFAMSSDGSVIVTVSNEGVVYVWSGPGYEKVQKLSAPGVVRASQRSVAISGDGSRIASALGGERVLVWDGPGHKRKRILSGNDRFLSGDDNISDLAISSDGSTIVAGEYGGRVRVWNGSDFDNAFALENHAAGGLDSVAVSSNGSRVASRLDEDICVWYGTNFDQFELVNNERFGDEMALSPDGLRLTTSTYRGLRYWDYSPRWLNFDLLRMTKRTTCQTSK